MHQLQGNLEVGGKGLKDSLELCPTLSLDTEVGPDEGGDGVHEPEEMT